MKIKAGVGVSGLRPELVLAVIVVQPILAKYNQELVITSAIDSKHSVGSLHYVGLALDLRTWNLGNDAGTCVHEMKDSLGGEYDVVLESDHIHLEYQPEHIA